MEKFYITTPIYYVNDVPHIGHAYTTIIADTLARYHRLKGIDTFFLTGTDEHGQKIEQAAEKKGFTVKQYADEISGKFKELWDYFGISYDYFIRTTDESHKQSVQKAFEKMTKNGDIYKGEYEGFYCVSCETFFTQTQLLDGNCCPDCGKQTSLVKEASYFFKLSAYQDKLLEWYTNDENCVIPRSKKNEVISFVKQGLKDLSITRTSFSWGVKLPKSLNSPEHVIYVWLDALMNYLSALGYGSNEEKMDFWPANYHLVGKDILRFHAIYWPAFLMSLDLPLPKHVAAHGWWTRNGEKMSKSKGNVVNPREIADAYGLDNFRFFLLREVPFGQDGDFSQRALIDRINSDLGNELGNLLNRIIGMSEKYNNKIVTSANVLKFYKNILVEAYLILEKTQINIKEIQLNRFLEDLWKILTLANQAITIHEPWTKIKEGKIQEALALVGLCANLLGIVSVMLYSIMPETCKKISDSLGFEINTEIYNKLIVDKKLLDDFEIKKIPPLFPKIEEELIKTIEESVEEEKENINININYFSKIKIKVGTIISANEVPNSDKLLLFSIDIGEDKPRQIISGIKEFYSPESLVGTQVCVLSNLKPAKIRGIISQGMLLTAEDENVLSLIRPEKSQENGVIIG